MRLFNIHMVSATPCSMVERNVEVATRDKLRKYKALLQGSTDV